ncbi:MAG: M20/M25/M40 family metallo-hydrolase [Lachnospiraceae bacterium]|nr:M20/M25/M40 family metallo-hydrolase [Lachnospiraceae bacterium]
MMGLQINEERIKKDFAALVAVDSVSFYEGQMAERMTEALKKLGFSVWEDDAAEKLCDARGKFEGRSTGPCEAGEDGRETDGLRRESPAGNLYGFLKGTLPGRPVLFSAHLDTVRPGHGKRAVFQENGRITSGGDTVLGADDAAGLAEILEGIRCVIEAGLPRRDIEILFSVAEEAHCKGSARFDYSRIRAGEAYVLDLSGAVGSAAVQAPSIVTFEATVNGKAAHAGFAPEDGVHAIAVMCEAISRIPQGRSCAGTGEETTLNIGSIRAKGPTNIVPSLCVCSGEIRSCSHERAMEMADFVRKTFEEAAARAGASCDVRVTVNLTAYQTPKESPAVRHFQEACGALSLPGTLVRTFGGSDNNNFALHDISGIVLSCGMCDVHSIRESIRVEDLVTGARLVAELAISMAYNQL